MKFFTSLVVLATLTTSAFASVFPRDFDQLQADLTAVSISCKVVLATVSKPLSGGSLINLIEQSNDLSNKLNTLAANAKTTGTLPDNDAKILLANAKVIVENCMIPCLRNLQFQAPQLQAIKVPMHSQLTKLQTSYDTASANLISVCPAAEKAQATQVANEPKPQFATTLKAYT